MAAKEVIWSSTARSALKKTLEYYTERNGSPNYSLKLLGEIEDLLDTLSKSEFIGRLSSNKTTRVIPMKVYLIFYEVGQDQIEIVAFWDNRQDENKKDSPHP